MGEPPAQPQYYAPPAQPYGYQPVPMPMYQPSPTIIMQQAAPPPPTTNVISINHNNNANAPLIIHAVNRGAQMRTRAVLYFLIGILCFPLLWFWWPLAFIVFLLSFFV